MCLFGNREQVKFPKKLRCCVCVGGGGGGGGVLDYLVLFLVDNVNCQLRI